MSRSAPHGTVFFPLFANSHLAREHGHPKTGSVALVEGYAARAPAAREPIRDVFFRGAAAFHLQLRARRRAQQGDRDGAGTSLAGGRFLRHTRTHATVSAG